MTYKEQFEKTVLYRDDKGLVTLMCGAFDDEALMPVALNALIASARSNGWQGNLWHMALAQFLLENENPFSLSCERKRVVKSSLWDIALFDIGIIKNLFHVDCSYPLWNTVTHFTQPGGYESEAPSEFLDALYNGAPDEELLGTLAYIYEKYGCGIYGYNESFRLEGKEIIPVKGKTHPKFDDLIGYEKQKEMLTANTIAFISRKGSNNVLLYGDAGTGKSTSIQALLSDFAKDGLRIIEIYKHQFELIPDLMAKLAERNYSFILLLDDLSFEETETEYKYLKAVMEGGSALNPENVRIYATSNRRHLVRENYSDRSDMEHDGDIHRSETMEEKLSLASRFGLQIFYPAPTFKEYQGIVEKLAEKAGLAGGVESDLFRASAEWQIAHGSKSGRTAKQFVDSLKQE